MPTINHREIARRVELDGLERTGHHLSEALEKKELRPEDFSLKSLAENLIVNKDGTSVGSEIMSEYFDPNGPKKNLSLLEAAGAVSSTAFSNITGQIVYNKLLESYQSEAFVFTNAIPTIPTQLDGEKIAGITDIGDQAQIVAEAGTYPLAGVGEDYIETPSTVKRGVVVPVTREAVFFDRTGLILQRASKVGEALGVNKEKRAIDCVIDQNTTAHRYKWRGTTYATYATSGGHGVVNKKASNELFDWSDIDGAEQLFANMVDPNTGEPIMVMADTIIVTPQKFSQASMTLKATNVSLQAGGFAVTGNLYRQDSASPVGATPFSNTYRLMTSRLLPTRLAADNDWFLGNLSRSFAYMQNWGITVTQAPPNSEMEFTNDIMFRFKASERGAFATMDVRGMVWSAA
jgi:hypothetical protein